MFKQVPLMGEGQKKKQIRTLKRGNNNPKGERRKRREIGLK